jgi:MinD-like ATPase involved in chromosome partitioning or flagellar assembly
MLKTFEFIKKFEQVLTGLLKQKAICDYSLELKLSQEILVYIVSDDINSLESFKMHITEHTGCVLASHQRLFYEFITEEEAQSEFYDYLFEGEQKVHYGLRRSLHHLIAPPKYKVLDKKSPLMTFFSYKGGVGRTTSLALFAAYYAQQGKNIFIIDCDFEAPGLINFFNIDQFKNPKSGVIEYLMDKRFEAQNVSLNDYIYEVSAAYSGDGQIHLMPAGNIFGDDRSDFLEGLSRVDIHGASVFLAEFSELIEKISTQYQPDVILVDSRTGFNNTFGCLTQLSDIVVALAGDDIQNQPGLEFLLERFSQSDSQAELVLVLSIVSTSITKRFERFKSQVNHYAQDFNIRETESSEQLLPETPMFSFPRESMLEMIGTMLEDVEDFKYFTAKNAVTSYHPFFQYIEAQLIEKTERAVELQIQENDDGSQSNLPMDSKSQTLIHDVIPVELNVVDHDRFSDEQVNQGTVQSTVQIEDTILTKLSGNLPEPYGEDEAFEEQFFAKSFYIRQCMQDLFMPERRILLGGKGTGKTTFYRALQNEDFFKVLIKKSQREHLNFQITNMVTARGSDSGFIDFTANFGTKLSDEVFVKRLWTAYIWVTLFNQKEWETTPSLPTFIIKSDTKTAKAFKDIIENEGHCISIEDDLNAIDQELKSKSQRLIITFDRLDEVVKPMDWNQGIAPLIRFFQSNPWQYIQPKLFLRRDLFNKLGNITNKNALERQTISLEWSHDEMYAFFFKVVFAHAKEEFLDYLKNKVEKLSNSFIKNDIEKVLNKPSQYNQLPANSYLLKPLVNAFFGNGQYANNNAYESLYYNLKNANNTISLRPFLDLIKFSIEEQLRDDKYRRGAILGLDYCFYKSVRARAVERHFNDLADEEGNDIIRFVIQDIKDGNVAENLKYSTLFQNDFEKWVKKVKENHPKSLKNDSVATFEEMLVLNGIMFVTTVAGNRKKYSFAFLYKHYLELKSPRQKGSKYNQ